MSRRRIKKWKDNPKFMQARRALRALFPTKRKWQKFCQRMALKRAKGRQS